AGCCRRSSRLATSGCDSGEAQARRCRSLPLPPRRAAPAADPLQVRAKAPDQDRLDRLSCPVARSGTQQPSSPARPRALSLRRRYRKSGDSALSMPSLATHLVTEGEIAHSLLRVRVRRPELAAGTLDHLVE